MLLQQTGIFELQCYR